MFYFLVALFAVFVSGKLFRQACGTISIYKPNMMSWIYYYDFLLFTVIGAILVVNSIDYHYMIDKLTYSSSRVIGFWAILYTLVFFPIGMKCANSFFTKQSVKTLFQLYTTRPLQLEQKYNDRIVRFLLEFFSIVCIISVIYVLYILGEVPLFKFFSSSSALEFTEFRIRVSRDFQGNEYVKNLFALTMTPLLSYVAYGYKLRDKNFISKIWFYTMLFFSLLILTYNFEKSPVLIYILGFMFYRVYYVGQINKKLIIGIFLGILVLIVGMYYVFMAEGGIDVSILFSYNSGILGRLLLSQGAGTFLSFDTFPESIKHVGFASVSKFFADMFGLDYSERSARLIMEYINPSGVRAGTAGVVNSLFIGEAWANFGLIGVVVAPLYVGFLIQSLYLFFLKSPKTPFLLALFVSFSCKSAITGGINDYFYNINFLFLFCFLLCVYGGSSIFRYTLKKVY